MRRPVKHDDSRATRGERLVARAFGRLYPHCPVNAVRKLVPHLALAVFGVLLALLLLEGLLQVAAFVAARVGPRASIAGTEGARRVLSLGDSNTYGLYVEHEQAYPQVLERLWNSDPRRGSIEVVNLGFPGTNSSTVRKNLPGLIRQVRPDLVTVLIGTNDFWTVPEETLETDSVASGFSDFAWSTSRLYRLFYIWTREFEVPELEGDYSLENPLPFETNRVTVNQGGEEFVLGFVNAGGRGEVQGWRRRLVANLEAILAIAEERGVEVVMLSYLAEEWPYARTNELLRRFARKHEVRFIDQGAALKPSCTKVKCAELLSDLHPSVAGHEFTAEILLREFE